MLKKVLFFTLNFSILTILSADVNIGGLATGQTTSYADYDDGYYQKGTPRSFDRNDTTQIVTDNVTGLMWQDDEDVGSIQKNWEEAVSYCSSLTLGSYDDWRLPEVKELHSIAESSKYQEAIIYDSFLNTNSFEGIFWTIESSSEGMDKWIVSMASSYSTMHMMPEENVYIRCIRGTNNESSKFIKVGNDTVVDIVNNKQWQDNESVNELSKSWSDAINYCENSNLSNYTDWRLPNLNELISIQDYTKFNLNTTESIQNILYSEFEFFPSGMSAFWSSSTSYDTGAGNILAFWIDTGSINFGSVSDNYNFRCIRDMDTNISLNQLSILMNNELNNSLFGTVVNISDINNTNISLYAQTQAMGSVDNFQYAIKDSKGYITSNSTGTFDVLFSIGDHKEFVEVNTAYLPSSEVGPCLAAAVPGSASFINSAGQLDNIGSATTILPILEEEDPCDNGRSFDDSITYEDNGGNNARVIKFGNIEPNQEYKLLFRFNTDTLIALDGATLTMELYKDTAGFDEEYYNTGTSLGTKSFTPNEEYVIPLAFDDEDASYMISLTPNETLIQAEYDIGLAKVEDLSKVEGYYYYKKYSLDNNGNKTFDIVLPKDRAYKFEWLGESNIDLNITSRGDINNLTNSIEMPLRAGIYTINASGDSNSSFYLMISDSDKNEEFEPNDNIFGANNYYGAIKSTLEGSEKDFYVFKPSNELSGNISFDTLPSDSYLTLELYDTAGIKIKTKYLTSLTSNNDFTLDGTTLNSDEPYFLAIKKISDTNNSYELTINNATNATLQKESAYAKLYDDMMNSSSSATLNSSLELVLDEVTVQKDAGELIILTGDSDNTTDALYTASQKLSITAYNRFSFRGLNDNDIYWINGNNSVDIDSDGKDDNVVDSNTLTDENFYNAIALAKQSSKNGPLYIYMVDHGANGSFKVSNGEIIYSSDFASALNTFTTVTQRDVVVIMEACKSGSFEGVFKDNDKIALIASSQAGELSYIDAFGSVSFTKLFLDNLLAGSSIEDSFTSSQTSLASLGGIYTKQTPLYSASSEIGSISVGGNFAAASMSLTSIDSVYIDGTNVNTTPTIDLTTDKNIAIETSITAASGISKVWAVIIAPDYTPPSVDEDYITPDLADYTFDLIYDTNTQTYKSTYTIPTEETYSGTYAISIYVEDVDGLVYTYKTTLTGDGDAETTSLYLDTSDANGSESNTTVPSEEPTTEEPTTEEPTSEEPTSANLNITTGWNLISLPVDTTISYDNLSSKFTNANTIWKYSNGWKAYGKGTNQTTLINAGISKIVSISKGEGFWVNSSSSNTVELSGDSYDTTTLSSLTSASTGWHLLGSGSDVSASQLNSSNSNINTVWSYNNGWSAYSPSNTTQGVLNSAGISELNSINQGQGFWVNIK